MGRPLSPLARRLGLRVGRRGAGCLAHSDAVTCSIYRWRPDENLAWGIVRQAQQDTEYSPPWGVGGACDMRAAGDGGWVCNVRPQTFRPRCRLPDLHSDVLGWLANCARYEPCWSGARRARYFVAGVTVPGGLRFLSA